MDAIDALPNGATDPAPTLAQAIEQGNPGSLAPTPAPGTTLAQLAAEGMRQGTATVPLPEGSDVAQAFDKDWKELQRRGTLMVPVPEDKSGPTPSQAPVFTRPSPAAPRPAAPEPPGWWAAKPGRVPMRVAFWYENLDTDWFHPTYAFDTGNDWTNMNLAPALGLLNALSMVGNAVARLMATPGIVADKLEISQSTRDLFNDMLTVTGAEEFEALSQATGELLNGVRALRAARAVEGLSFFEAEATSAMPRGWKPNVVQEGLNYKGIPYAVADNFPKGAGGWTSVTGDIYLSQDLVEAKAFVSPEQQLAEVEHVLYHELGHRKLSPTPGPLQGFRASIKGLGYDNSHLLRYLEEGMAESYGMSRGTSWFQPSAFARVRNTEAYKLARWRLWAEGGIFLGVTLGAPPLVAHYTQGQDNAAKK
jgi:hypothetical protein